MVTENGQAETAYGMLFARYLEEGLRHSLAEVQADPHKTPDEVREQAWHLLSFALRGPGAWPAAADLLLALSPKMLQAGYREQWLAYLEGGLACARAAGDERSAAALQLEIGELLRHLGRLDAADVCFRAAQAVFLAAGDGLQAAAAQVCLANLAFLREQWAEAVRLSEEVLAAVPQTHYVRARALFVAAEAFAARHDDDEASRSYRESEQLWQSLGERRWAALCEQNLAWFAAKCGALDAARTHYAKALAQFADLRARQSEGVVCLKWGVTEYLAGNTVEARSHYRRAEEVFRQIGDTRFLAMTCNNLGLLYFEQQDLQQAEFYYLESVGLWRELGATLARINVETGLAHILIKRGCELPARELLARLQAELAQTERNQEHRRLYRQICDFRSRICAE